MPCSSIAHCSLRPLLLPDCIFRTLFFFYLLIKLYAPLLRARMHRETLIQGTALTEIVKDKFTM